jgi:DNA recombination protein RmuC
MESIIFIIVGLILGIVVGTLIGRNQSQRIHQTDKDNLQQKYATLELEYTAYKSTKETETTGFKEALTNKIETINKLEQSLIEKQSEINNEKTKLATAIADFNATKNTLAEKEQTISNQKVEIEKLQGKLNTLHTDLATITAQNNALNDKLNIQHSEMEQLNQKFTVEFENIANKILETKTQKFTDLNKENLKGILEPLGKNIDEFKKQVDEVYKNEAKERFSLDKEIKRLAELNQLLGAEAKNLTKALKGEAKTQGRWGEVILEKILEKSGLRKGEEYFMEYQLFGADGKALRSESEGKKMRPDAIIMYPDNRHIIIDSKVSLNAFIRLVESEDEHIQKTELEAHVTAIKSHINELSKKAYDDYNKTLDFVMMFIPNEPAYITAMQGDPELWNYAYDKRILLISPTNLIAALKLIVDLWKREYQNQNAQAIAERGAKMYDKFVGFVNNLSNVGKQLENASEAYNEAYKQLTTGNDNLVAQATKLKNLGIKIKKEIPSGISDLSLQSDAIEKE